MFKPHLDVFVDVLSFLIKTKIKANTKLTVIMLCQIFDRKFIAPSSGNSASDRRRGRPVDKIRNFYAFDFFSERDWPTTSRTVQGDMERASCNI